MDSFYVLLLLNLGTFQFTNAQTCPVPIIIGTETITERVEKVIYPTTDRVKVEWQIYSGNAFTNFGISKDEE